MVQAGQLRNPTSIIEMGKKVSFPQYLKPHVIPTQRNQLPLSLRSADEAACGLELICHFHLLHNKSSTRVA
jgi:hypothetical protein